MQENGGVFKQFSNFSCIKSDNAKKERNTGRFRLCRIIHRSAEDGEIQTGDSKREDRAGGDVE